MKLLDKFANVAVLVAVVVFLYVVTKDGYHSRISPKPGSPDALVGTEVTLPGITLPSDRESIVLAISTWCRFCKENLPFYRELSKEVQGKLSVFAILPQKPQEADQYIYGAGLQGVAVVSGDLKNIGVYATPTLLLVDRSGRVKQAWVGELDDDGQRQLVASLALSRLTVSSH